MHPTVGWVGLGKSGDVSHQSLDSILPPRSCWMDGNQALNELLHYRPHQGNGKVWLLVLKNPDCIETRGGLLPRALVFSTQPNGQVLRQVTLHSDFLSHGTT